MCITLAQQHRSDSDAIGRHIAEGKLNLSDVVNESCHRQHVKSAKGAFLKTIVKTNEDVDAEDQGGLTGPAPCGSSWFPWIEKTGIATLRLLSS